MEILAVLGIIVAALVLLVLRPGPKQDVQSTGCAVAGLTALFFVVAVLLVAAFIFVPPMRDWMDELVGPGQSGDAFGMGRLVLFFIYAGGISSLISLAVVLIVARTVSLRSTSIFERR